MAHNKKCLQHIAAIKKMRKKQQADPFCRLFRLLHPVGSRRRLPCLCWSKANTIHNL